MPWANIRPIGFDNRGVTAQFPQFFPVGAYVCAERVGEFAEKNLCPAYPVLKAAMTHEVRHLLLHGGAHCHQHHARSMGAERKMDAVKGGLRSRHWQQIRTDVSKRMSGSKQRDVVGDN